MASVRHSHMVFLKFFFAAMFEIVIESQQVLREYYQQRIKEKRLLVTPYWISSS